MTVALTRSAVDIGIVTNNPDGMVAFYRDLLGFTEEPSTPFPMGGTMYRLRCGDSLIKVVAPEPGAKTQSPRGAIAAATGIRYWTMHVSNLAEIMAKCEHAGVQIVVPVTELRPGVSLGMVADPDGNCVEFVTYS